MDNCVGCVLRAETEMEDGKNLRTWVDCQPQPQDAGAAAEPGAQFVQLEIRKLEVAEKVLVEGLSMLPSAGKPGGDSRLTVAEDTLGSGWVQPTGSRCQHDCDLLGRGFQTIQRGVAPSTERGTAGRASKRLDLFSVTMGTIPKEAHERERL
jgi:hypothetical protein